MSDSVGFIGLGIMGEGMAKCLLKSGRKLHVWNRSTAKSTALASEFPDAVTVCETPAAVLAACDLVYAILSTPEVVKAVYEMEHGVLAGVRDGSTKIVDCATLAAEDMARLNAQVHERGGRFLEAPVSGSKGPAAAGQLIFLTSGDQVGHGLNRAGQCRARYAVSVLSPPRPCRQKLPMPLSRTLCRSFPGAL